MLIIKNKEFKMVEIVGNEMDSSGDMDITMMAIENHTNKIYILTYDAKYGEMFDIFTPKKFEHFGYVAR